MILIDLTSSYCKNILKEGDLSGYRKSYPSFFNHYFRFWANKKYWRPTIDSAETVYERRKLITSRFPALEKKLKKHSLDTANLSLILFVGQNTSNGHAFYNGREYIVWLPLEAYETARQVDIFATHEIIHALHYARQRLFYFTTTAEKRLVSRQLITEGLATWATRHILKQSALDALWADYISKQDKIDWLKECRKQEEKIKAFFKRNLNSRSAKIEIFLANNEKDVFSYRGGYYAGLKAIENVSRYYDLSLTDLLVLSPKEFKEMIKETYLV